MLFRRLFFSQKDTIRYYIIDGLGFAQAVRKLPYGENEDFLYAFDSWEIWEKRFANEGFRTLSLDAFLGRDGRSISVDTFTPEQRKRGEKPIYHANIYREHYLGNYPPIFSFTTFKKFGCLVQKDFVLPSTEKYTTDRSA